MTRPGERTRAPVDAEERTIRRLHAGLLLALGAGLAIWLWRTYGFAPLRIVEAAR